VNVDALSKLLRDHGMDDDAIERAVRIATGEESEEDAIHAAVRKGLEKSGLDEEAVEEIAGRVLKNRHEAAEDRLPANALKHGSISSGGLGGYGHGHKHGAHEMAHDDFNAMFDTARLRSVGRDGNFSYGAGDKVREMEREARRQPRQKLAYDARGTRDDNSFLEMFPGAARLFPSSM
jgi:hypothetical protein